VVFVALYGIGLVYLLALAPAAVICCFKERWGMFFLGWLTFGLAWIIGALSGEPRRRLGVVALVTLAAVLVLGAFGARPAPVLGLDGETLESSVGNGIWFYNFKSCDRLPDGGWRCGRWDSQYSGERTYRVDVDGFGCWHAERLGPQGDRATPEQLSGCVHLGNYLL
jgi:hypothetical protein